MASMLGAGGGVMELDETMVGGKEGKNFHRGRQRKPKAIVMTLIDREGDAVAVHVPNTKKSTLQKVAKPIVDQSANIVTDARRAFALAPRRRPFQDVRARHHLSYELC